VSEDSELLAHYIARGREPWNTSLEAAWLDYELRAFVMARLPKRRSFDAALSVLNVGIGVGLFDDWLGHVIGASNGGRITSVDRDPDICRVFELRQRREGHPHPARVICGDVRDGVLGGETFDVITVVGSTLEESGDRGATTRALQAAVAPGGVLLVAEVGQGATGDRVLTCGDVWLACQTREGAQPPKRTA
jgi:protein-L-isoaspartate O-methyltransferase